MGVQLWSSILLLHAVGFCHRCEPRSGLDSPQCVCGPWQRHHGGCCGAAGAAGVLVLVLVLVLPMLVLLLLLVLAGLQAEPSSDQGLDLRH